MRRTLFVIAAFSMLVGAVIAGEQTSPRSIRRSYELSGRGGLHVRVEFKTLTGQWHLAERLTISLGDAPPLVRQSIVDGDGDIMEEVAPLIEKVYSVEPNRWVLLGWSSSGEGLQRNYAWVVEATSPGLRLSDRLEYETDRLSAGFALDTSKQVFRIGIPCPKKDVHLPENWQLVVGNRHLGIDGIRGLSYSRRPLEAIRQFYAPPTAENPRKRDWDERFAWFELKAGSFSESNP